MAEQLAIVISAKDNFSQTFNKLGGSVSGAESAMKRAEEGSRYFLGALVALGAAAGTYIVHATLTAARTETLGIAMGAVAKATGTSTKVLAEQEKILKKQGITTQEARSILTLFMQSQLDVADAAKIARVAQDLAVISNQNSSQAAKTLTEAIASQEPMLLRNFGIVKNLPEIYDAYGKSIGKSGSALTEIEKKQAMVNLILEEGEKVAGTYEKAMGTAGKQLTSLPRFFEEAANSIGQVFLPALGKAIEVLTNFLKAITPENIEKWIKKIKDAPGPLFAMAGAISGAVTPALWGMSKAAWATYAPLAKFIAVGAAVGGVAYLVYKNWDIVVGVWKKIAPYLKPVIDLFKQAGAIIKDSLIASIKNLQEAWANLEPYHDLIKEFLKVAAAGFITGLVGPIVLVVGAVTLLIVAFSKIVQGITWVIAQVTWFASNFKSIIGGAWDWVKNAVSSGIQAVVKFFSELPGKAGAFLADFFGNKLPYYIGYGLGYMVKSVDDAYIATVAWFKRLPSVIGSLLFKTVSLIQQRWAQAKAGSIATVSYMCTAIFTWFKKLPGKIASYLRSLPGKVYSAFISARNKAVSALLSLLRYVFGMPGRIASAFSRMGSAAWNAIKGWFSKIAAGFRAAMRGESSPGFVKVFAGELKKIETTYSAFMARFPKAVKLGFETPLAPAYAGAPTYTAPAPAMPGRAGDTTAPIIHNHFYVDGKEIVSAVDRRMASVSENL